MFLKKSYTHSKKETNPRPSHGGQKSSIASVLAAHISQTRISLLSADPHLLGIWCLSLYTFISSFSIISSYCISRELIALLHHQLPLVNQDLAFWFPLNHKKLSKHVVV